MIRSFIHCLVTALSNITYQTSLKFGGWRDIFTLWYHYKSPFMCVEQPSPTKVLAALFLCSDAFRIPSDIMLLHPPTNVNNLWFYKFSHLNWCLAERIYFNNSYHYYALLPSRCMYIPSRFLFLRLKLITQIAIWLIKTVKESKKFFRFSVLHKISCYYLCILIFRLPMLFSLKS